nr:hypothetical protein [Tanacetum cinerariifolium]
DDQILSHIRWVPIGKSSCYLDVERWQSNPIYKIAVDILKHTNFFRAFTSSSTIPSIYTQQFWDTVQYDKTVGCYKCQLDEQWFDLTKDILRDALQITPVNDNNAFSSPPTLDALINFVNDLGKQYYKEYLEKVVKHQRYIAGEKRSDHDSHAPKPAMATKKSKPLVPKVDLRPPVIKPASSQQPEPKPAPEPRFDDKEVDIQRAVEESLKSVYDAPRGPLPPMVIREPDFGKYQPLLEVILEELASSTGTLSSLQHLAKDLSFGDLFFNDKPSEVDNEKATAETEAESMVFVTIQQDTSAIPPMTTPVIDLTSRPDSPNVHRPLQATTTKTTTTTTTTTTHPLPPQPQQSTTDSMLIKRIDELEHIIVNLIQDNKHLEERLDSHGVRLYTLENLDIPQQNRFRDLPKADMKEILHQQIWETNSYKSHEDHMILYESLEKSMNRDHTNELLKDLAEARPSRTSESPGASGSSQVLPPPPPPPSTNQE